MNPKAIRVKYKTPYKLEVKFTNGEERVFNLQPYLSFPVYERLMDEAFCNKAKVQNVIVVWDEEINIQPDKLYFESVLR